MRYGTLIFIAFITACSQNNKQPASAVSASATVTSNDTVPAVRKEVSKSPVASYIVPINNPLLHQYFGVKVFETPLTFRFLLQMQYEGVLETDTLKIPNFGIWPIVKVIKGAEEKSCIIGFLDKEKRFREYKMLQANGNKLKLVVLKSYGVGVFSSAK